MLLRYGCDINRKFISNGQRLSPLEAVARLFLPSLVRIFWAAGSNPGCAATWCQNTVPWDTSEVQSDNCTELEIDKEEVISFLKHKVQEPRCLKDLCRISIRTNLRQNIESKVKDLQLTKAMKAFLNLPEIDEEISVNTSRRISTTAPQIFGMFSVYTRRLQRNQPRERQSREQMATDRKSGDRK